jgi:ABC-type Fe3+/spermidine/putrescine transport system ATPase subunit
MALLEIAGVSKRFGAVLAVDDVSLTVERGALFALLGPSGCGKTTLLRMIAGFEIPDSGHILIDGVDVTALPPYARPINMMFQSYALFPHMDVAGNIAFGLRQEGMDRRRIAARVGEMLALVRCRIFVDVARMNCRAVSASAWHWRARSPRCPSCCCSTSRSPHWTASSVQKLGLS